MRRRLLSLCLVLCMVLGMLPATAMATDTALLTVSAGGVDYAASYMGTGGESLGENGSVYAVQIPENTAVSIRNSAAAAGSYTASNVSGGLMVSFQEYPLELTAEELSKCILTEEQKAGCTDVGIDLSLGSWACILLSDGETQQYLFILLGDAGVMAADAAEIPVANNVIDITDNTVATRSNIYNAKAENITVSGADVVSATEDGTTVNILLHGTTAPDATVSVKFGTKLDNNCSMTGTEGSATLTDGSASLSMTLSGKAVNKTGTATYTLNFSLDDPPAEVPTRLVESVSVEAYTGVAKEISLEDYYENASNYYLVEGETLTELDEETYTFKTTETGEYTLTFTASNVVGTCPDYVTVTVTVTEIQSGTWVGYETSSGSMDYVLFTDASGAEIDGLTASVDGQTINVTLPQTFATNGSVTATFGLTQNGGYPFLSTKTATAGTSDGKAVNNKFTSKATTLSNGAATFTFYYFNAAPNGSNQITWKINYKVFNNIPALVEGAAVEDTQTITAGESYQVTLSDLFSDADGQPLNYKVSLNGGEYAVCDADYSYSTNVAGTYTLVFKANDGTDDSEDTYTVNLTVENSDVTYAVPVAVAESVEGLNFYADSLSGEELTYEEGSVQVPENVAAIWWKTADGCNGTAAVSNGTSLTLQQTTFVVKTALGDVDTGAAVTVTDPDGNVVSGNGFVYLLGSGEGYTFKAAPGSSYSNGWATNTLTAQTVTEELSAEIVVELAVKSPKTITVDKGAELKVYYQPKYYVLNEVQPVCSVDNGDTITYTYSCPNKQENSMGYLYYATMEGLIDKGGYLNDTDNTTVTWSGETRTGSYRADYDTSTTYGSWADDSVYVNINSHNHLVLTNGSSFRLRGLRLWEIVNSDTGNVIIQPEFTYTRYGSDIFTLSNVASPICGTGGNNWVDLTATGSGVAFLEVGYNAVHIVDGYDSGSYGGATGIPGNFTYNASDPARTALIVVQTDGNNASDVTFGIRNNYGGTWDAEFDTLYFTEDYGQITFTPSASSGIGSVAVSNNKGESFTALTADENGTYTAGIAAGANVIQITNGNGQTAYQVVRGDKITASITNITSGKESNAAIEPGDTVRITLDGVHQPVGKLSGMYNAKAQQVTYLFNGDKVQQSGYSSYNLPANTWIEVTVPTEILEDYTLTGGYITLSSYGDPYGTHRSLTDSGKGQNTVAETRYGNLVSLPDIEIPVVIPTYEVTLTEGEGYTITAAEGSENPVKQGGSFSFTVTAAEGYDGTNMVVKANDTEVTAEDGVYTIEGITADQTVTVEGVTKAAAYKVTLTEGEGYTIAATEGSENPVAAGGSFSFTVYPAQGYHLNNAVVKAGDTVLTAENEIYTISNITQDIVVTVEGVEEVIENQKTVTVPAGAEVHVYFQSGYSSGNGNDKEIAPVKTVSNGETVTYYYSLKTAGGSYVAFYGDKIPYAGYFNSVSDVILSWDGETRTPAYRGDYDTSTTYGSRGEDSVYTNVNSNGHLVLNEEFMLRSYRGWQIINTDTANIMIEPEFNYSASNSNITVTPYNERTDSTVTASGTSSNNWVYLTPNGSGITYLEIGYDAVHIVDGYEAGAGGGAEGQPSNFTWNASDPNRTALIVVQTDGNAASGITFGIQSPSGGWDYEYDTVYFTESQGSLTMVPTGDVATVSVSHDKGGSYQTLTGTDGTYTVPIIPGNNIIKITDSNGRTAFQVVRGEQISYTVTNLTTGADTVSVGDSVRVTFHGLHTACPKISGIYNPGYPNTNTLGYKLNGTTVTQSEGYQYNIHNNAWIEFTAPNATCVLSGGYLDTPPSYGSSVGGLYQASAVNSSGTSSTRRNIFPEITIQVEGTQVIPAQSIKLDMQSASMGIGGTLMLTATLEPLDATDEILWSSSNETVVTVEDGTVTAHAAGKATITVTAGEASATCEIEVKDQASGSFTLKTDLYDLPADEIYVATCGLSQITVSGPVPVGEIIGGEGPEWSVNILEGTGDTVTVSMTGVSHAAAVAKRRFWYNGNVSDVTLADCTDGTFAVNLEPEWDGDTAIVTLGLGSAKKIVGDTYTITMTRVKAQEDKTYTVTLTEGEGYTIAACEGSENPVTEGGSFSFTVTVADGYDGTNMEVLVGDSPLKAENGVYTIEAVTEDVTITVKGIEKSGPVSGDLDGDGSVNVTDAGLAYAAIKGTQTLTDEQKQRLDVNGDGKLNITDAGMLYAYVKGTITSFPSGNE